MNGLSIEKIKRYDKAIKRAKGLIDFSSDSELKTLEYVFPELRESEDERIRKEILDYIDKATGCKRWVAWLEKQGEQRSTDKVEPKFKVGDWCIDNEDGTIFQIVKVLDKTYRYRTNEGKEYSCTHYSLELDARLWTIQDAKNGDVLVDSLGNVCIYQEPSTKLMYHSHCYGNHKYFICMGGSHEIVGSYPATKEQRDKFEKAMADAGYVFDFEKKELKEIEDEEYNDEDYGIDGLWHAKNILEKTLGKVEGYQTDDGILDHKCAISAVDRLYKHSIAWSEKDKHWMQKAIDFMNHPDLIKATPTLAKDTINWLKSLEERVIPKQKQEWSEEDEKMVAKYLYEKKGYPIDVNGNLLSFDETMKDAEKYLKYKQDKFIKKASRWLKDCLDNGMWIANDVGCAEKDVIIEHFQNYMKGE